MEKVLNKLHNAIKVQRFHNQLIEAAFIYELLSPGKQEDPDLSGNPELSKLINKYKNNLNDDLDIKTKRIIFKVQEQLAEDLHSKALNNYSDLYNSDLKNNLYKDFFPLSQGEKQKLLENESSLKDYNNFAKHRDISYGHRQKKIRGLAESQRNKIKQLVLSYFNSEKSKYKIKKFKDDILQLEHLETGKSKALELFPFSYAAKSILYPGDKITEPTIIPSSEEEYGILPNSLIAFYNQYPGRAEGIHLIETTDHPSNFNHSFHKFLTDPRTSANATIYGSSINGTLNNNKFTKHDQESLYEEFENRLTEIQNFYDSIDELV